MLLLLSLGMLGAFLAIHVIWFIHPSDIASIDELNAVLTDGQPTIVNFYSNF